MEAKLSDIILKGTHPVTIPVRFGLIWFSGFRLNHITPNLLGMVLGWVRQLRPPFKMGVVTKNRNFFNCPLLL
jgi:hypothetical protein